MSKIVLALYLALTCTDKINYDVLKWMYSPVDVVKCMQFVDKIGHNDSGTHLNCDCEEGREKKWAPSLFSASTTLLLLLLHKTLLGRS